MGLTVFNPNEISPRMRTFASKTAERPFEDVQIVQFEILLISFRYCFDQKIGTKAQHRKPY